MRGAGLQHCGRSLVGASAVPQELEELRLAHELAFPGVQIREDLVIHG